MWFRRGYDKVEAAKETSRLVEDGAGSSTANMEIVAASNGEEEDKEEKPNLWVDRVITALFVVVFMTVIFFTTAGRRNRWEERKKADIANTMTYRPVCQSHIKARKVKVLQTGLQEPTLKWAPQECAFSPSVQTYRSVDAEIQVELNMFAHPDRLPIMGFGGAFTEASALNFNSLTEPGREMVMKLLFGKEEGLGYALGRVHINSCDFSLQSYAYDMTDGDFELEDFSVQHDIDVGMVDMMKRARTFYDWNDDGIKYYASPWSPPPWMKAPTPDDPKGALHAQNMTNSAQPICLRGYDRPGGSPYAKAWALYFAKFIEHYKELGLDIFAVTIQNEPGK
jgi:glucosylceramidase